MASLLVRRFFANCSLITRAYNTQLERQAANLGAPFFGTSLPTGTVQGPVVKHPSEPCTPTTNYCQTALQRVHEEQGLSVLERTKLYQGPTYICKKRGCKKTKKKSKCKPKKIKCNKKKKKSKCKKSKKSKKCRKGKKKSKCMKKCKRKCKQMKCIKKCTKKCRKACKKKCKKQKKC